MSAQEKQVVLAELVRRENEARSSSTKDKEGGGDNSLESLLLKLSDGTITDEEKKRLEALGIDPKDLEELSPPGSTAPLKAITISSRRKRYQTSAIARLLCTSPRARRNQVPRLLNLYLRLHLEQPSWER